LVEKEGSLKIHQGTNGGLVMAVREEKKSRPEWKCDVDNHSLFRRSLEDYDHHHDDNQHEHHDHEHHTHDHHDNDFDPAKSAIENLSNSIRGVKANPLNKRRVLQSSGSYNYQVDIFLEIDNLFISRTGQGSVQAAYNYINTLVTAANVIYEREIDTHLNVHTIKISTLYDNASSTIDVLNTMKNYYKGNAWHTQGVDIHHALLGMTLGGGVAYMGVLCNSEWGYGMTGSISGSFVDLNQVTVWDLTAFMHEIGHNFDSGHTHDINDYSPVIDNCGNGQCPSTSADKWATLMSYCHICNGWDGDANLMYTFGGIYDGSGSKSSIANWIDNPELVGNFDSTHMSNDPRRVSYKMYSHVSTRGSCTAVPTGPPPPSLKPTPSPTKKPTPPTLPPTPKPVTPAPTQDPSNFATFDSVLKVPKCAIATTSCSSGNLLDGIGNQGPAEQGNSPNTLGTCTDGALGTYHSDESVDAIVVSSIDGGILTAGKTAEITASIYAWSSTQDYVDFYYTTNPSNPTWALIGTFSPSGTGVRTVKTQYTLPSSGGLQAVRVVIRYSGSASTSNPFACPSSGYDDVDDLAFTVSGGGTLNPTFAPSWKPTQKPTLVPTNKPTLVPTNKPTPIPSKKPTQKPTVQPTKTPTFTPTNKPTAIPTMNPTQNPTNQPTKNPTVAPTNVPTAMTTSVPTPKPTLLPTSVPTKIAQTSPPTSSPPTQKPTTVPTNVPTGVPTPEPTSNGVPQDASFDSSFGAPRCAAPGTSCSSGTLLNGRGTISGGVEPNRSNTIDGCQDGNEGSYHGDESIDKIIVRSGEVDESGSGGILVSGGRATIIATVYAWSTGASDTADFFYTSDASSPNWQYIGSITPQGGSTQELALSYTLPTGANQAVRVQFRYLGSIGSCTAGSYNDRDDLVFVVSSDQTMPTSSPVQAPPPSGGGGAQQASYDASLTIPRCNAYGSKCDSLGLLNGRGTLLGGNEPNMPNALNSCSDGNNGLYYVDESIEKIVIRSGDIDDSGSGIDMSEGGRATIIATVFAWSTIDDSADFYYASDAMNPVWVFLGTRKPTSIGLQELKVSYDLPAGMNQVVRVNFRYRGSQGTNGACSRGTYDDTDDLAFTVKSNPAYSPVEAAAVVEDSTPKDLTADGKKRADLQANETGSGRKKTTSKAGKKAKRA
jgi:hypothetical protein